MLLALLALVFHIVTLTRYPVVSCDEGYYVKSALRYTDAVASGSSWPTPGGRTFYLPFGRSYWMLVGGSAQLLGPQLEAGRLISLLSLLAAVAATYQVGSRFASRQVGLWAAALISVEWLMLYMGHLSRPDMLATAAASWLIVLWDVAGSRSSGWLYLLLGALTILVLDSHFLALHLAWVVGAWVVFDLARRRVWRLLGVYIVGLVIGAALLIWLHLGVDTWQLMALFFSDPVAALQSYIGDTSAGAVQPGVLVGHIFRSFAEYWWLRYGWHIPVLSLVEAVFFMTGTLSALLNGPRLRLLGMLIVLSSLSFMATNIRTGYALFGYSILWIPLYTVVGVAAVFNLWGRWSPARLPAWTPQALLAGIAVLYISADLYLVSRRPPDAHARAVALLTQTMEPGSRVMLSRQWWFGFPNDLVFVDEELVMSPATNSWWNAVPDATLESQQDEISLVYTPLVERSETNEEIAERFAELRPDYVIADTVLGCNTYPSRESQFLLELVQTMCKPLEDVDTGITPEAAYYGVKTLYSCKWE